MGFLSKLLGRAETKLSQDEIERREIEGYISWHPDYGHVYYPPKVPAGLNEYNGYNTLNEPSGDDDSFGT